MENTSKPGVSGKNNTGKAWLNSEEYKKQLEEMDAVGSQKLPDKTDLSEQGNQFTGNTFADKVFQAVKEATTVDVSRIEVQEASGVIRLSGHVKDVKESRALENIVKNIKGVKSVVNNITPESKSVSRPPSPP